MTNYFKFVNLFRWKLNNKRFNTKASHFYSQQYVASNNLFT